MRPRSCAFAIFLALGSGCASPPPPPPPRLEYRADELTRLLGDATRKLAGSLAQRGLTEGLVQLRPPTCPPDLSLSPDRVLAAVTEGMTRYGFTVLDPQAAGAAEAPAEPALIVTTRIDLDRVSDPTFEKLTCTILLNAVDPRSGVGRASAQQRSMTQSDRGPPSQD